MVIRQHKDPFAAALIAHLPRLRRYATALAGSTGTADDLVQDCLERALRRRATLQNSQRMAGWLRTMLFDRYQELMRRPHLHAGIDITTMDNDLALSTPPEDRDATIDFIRALRGLSSEHRQILLLVGLEGLSYREVACELGIPIGTVMSRLARARQQLRNGLEEENELISRGLSVSGRRAEL
jgi:RNA polymerase sigma-70 factor (ECF subfamily)